MTLAAFQPLPERPSAVASCAEALRAAILRGEVAEGERLPPERALADRLGVNRTTLRAALRELEAAGLLRVRQGSGYVVRDWREAGGPGLLPDLAARARTRGELRPLCADLLDLRRRLAAAVLERLEARRPAASELAELEARVTSFAALAEGQGAPSEALVAADLGVLHALVELSGSPALGLFMNPVLGVLGALPELRAAIYADPRANAAAYGVLLAALREGGAGITSLVGLLEARDQATLAMLEREVDARGSGR